MNKTRNNELIKLASEALADQQANETMGVSKIMNGGNIEEAYNGSIASLGVSIAMSELRPALAIFYQDKPKAGTRPKANRRSVLDVIGRIVTKDAIKMGKRNWDFSEGGRYAENLFRYAISNDDKELKTEVVDCAIALKQIVRTYNLV
jgi:hypothetical protein